MEHLLAILAGAGLFLWGLQLWRQRKWLFRNGQFTMGTIIGHDDGPIIQFYTRDQQPITVKPSASPSKRRLLNGASIGLYYNPENPQDFVPDTTDYQGIPLLFMITGIAFFLGGLFSAVH